MSKQRKKYNPKKIMTTAPDSITDDTASFQLPGKKCSFVHVPSCSLMSNDLRRLGGVYTHRQFIWTTALLVFRINSRGDKAFDVHHVSPADKCRADSIAESVEKAHNDMIAKTPTSEFIAAGWLALPRKEILSSVFLHKLFDKLGVWESYITDNGNVLGGNNAVIN